MIRETGWLTAWGHLALKHWKAHRPEMAAALEAEGCLVEAAKEAQFRAQSGFELLGNAKRYLSCALHMHGARSAYASVFHPMPFCR